MVMSVEIISEETIKLPSSPTPNLLKNLKLSFLDQIAPPVYVPIVLFYDHCPRSDQIIINPSEKSSCLKKSLAKTLTRFYLLAGTIKEDFSIDCDNVGAEYYESRVTCKLSEVIKNPSPNVLNQFLPFEPHGNENGLGREVLVAVQFNIFNCGGVAIGVCISHKVADGTSAITFVNDWAATSRGASDKVAVYPIFVAASYFPPKKFSGSFLSNIGITAKDNIVTKRFVFDKVKINALKEEAISAKGSLVKSPTRVEAVSAFIWKRFMAIARSKSTPAKLFAAVLLVNLRPRMDPPLPTESLANVWQISFAPSTLEAGKQYHVLVSQLRNAIKQIDGDYVKKLQSGGDGHMSSMKSLGGKFSNGEIEFCNFTSWYRFPVYEVDFGWGKPSWVCSPSRPFKNVVILMSTKDGDGIEAWVNMVDEDMALFERDAELLSFVSSPTFG